jgi:hypothetical protein
MNLKVRAPSLSPSKPIEVGRKFETFTDFVIELFIESLTGD